MSPRDLKTEVQDISSVCLGDCCMGAVKRAYRELREQGEAPGTALHAARTVFAWHHPEVPALQAETIVEHWVREGAIH